MQEGIDSFGPARSISRWLDRFFTFVIFTAPLLLAALSVAFVLLYEQVFVILKSQGLSAEMPPFLGVAQRLMVVGVVIIYCVPILIEAAYLRRLFSSFARQSVFTTENVMRLRSIGAWLIASAVMGNIAQALIFLITKHPNPDVNIVIMPVLYAAMVYVIAYVLEEATRIAHENEAMV